MHRIDFGLRRRADDPDTSPMRRSQRPTLARVHTLWVGLEAVATRLERAQALDRALPPAAPWILDNLHVAEEHVSTLECDLTPAFLDRLPLQTDADGLQWPRIQQRLAQYLDAQLSHVEAATLRAHLRAPAQAHPAEDPCTLAELWATPLMLRWGLLQSIAQGANEIALELEAEAQADAFADHLLDDGEWTRAAGTQLTRALDEAAHFGAFVAQLVHRLRHHAGGAPACLEALSARLAQSGTSVERLIENEQARNARQESLVGHAFASLRRLGAMDWPRFVEEVSEVDQLLRAHTRFGQSDFGTRDRYRHVIEELARHARNTESAVVHALIALGEPRPDLDPGHWLIGPGRPMLEAAVGLHLTPAQKVFRWIHRHVGVAHFFPVLCLTLAGVLVPGLVTLREGVPLPVVAWIMLLAVLPASEIALAAMQRVMLRAFPPRRLPRLRLAAGVPSEWRTIVAVPIMLTRGDAIEAQAELLEAHYLANRIGAIHFALITDWTDAASETTAGDAALLAIATQAIRRLNERYGLMPDAQTRFHVFHRVRQWNPGERTWMGWERKRGKLQELNRLLRGDASTSFVEPATPVPQGVRYVFTIDADTRLPAGTVAKLVGTAAHPLNQPRFESGPRPGEERVVAGYTIIQPRVSSTLPRGKERSGFRTIAGSAGGLDPYSVVVSDLYQDLFGSGSFVGKGLYDIDAFERVISPHMPENTVLSHDLLEGALGRCAFVGDIEVFDDFPSHAEVAASRSHRWARGDWQLLPWIIGARRHPIGAIDRWKMIDNLRRTLVPIASVLLLLTAWTTAGAPHGLWLAFVLLSLGFAPLLDCVERFVDRDGASWRQYLRTVGQTVGRSLLTWGFAFSFLAQNAWLMVDAIVRTLVRLAITRRNLLQWTTAAQAKADSRHHLPSFRWTLQSGAYVLLLGSALVLVHNPTALTAALPILALWWALPLLARRLSAPGAPAQWSALDPAVRQAFSAIARRTWGYFDRFVGEEDNHLPPDNFQEDPHPVVAHRTSPTNIGLYLLSLVAAKQCGWIGLGTFVHRARLTFETLARLETHRGHLLNWYDTRSLAPLAPRYVSTVDSGNLAGHLLVFAQACRAARGASWDAAAWASGLADVARILEDTLAASPHASLHASADRSAWFAQAQQACVLAQTPPVVSTSTTWREWLHTLIGQIDEARRLVAPEAPLDAETAYWLDAAHAQATSLWRDLLEATATFELSDQSLVPGAETLLALEQLEALARDLAMAMDFSFLFDRGRSLFAIGWRVDDGLLDESHYDLLASEARLASLVAIAKGDVPVRHWFKLGRPTAWRQGEPVPLSWSGSMFEYLMPELVLDAPPQSALGRAAWLVSAEQIEYGQSRGVPWGISESAFNARDRDFNYQYQNFGVPGLGLKRGLAADLVVAPYASALAAMVHPLAAASNFAALQALGALGRHGFVEAIDFTAERLPADHTHVLVRAYMAHHQGMSIVALVNVLHAGWFRDLFHAEPMIRANELLLEERPLRYAAPAQRKVVDRDPSPREPRHDAPRRSLVTSHTAAPILHTLGRRDYAVAITATGAGTSRSRAGTLTRYRPDVTDESSGYFVYIQDVANGDYWSAGFQPTAREPDRYEVEFAEEAVTIHRTDSAIETVMRVVVSPEDAFELRQVRLKNVGNTARMLEVTSYAEVVLGDERGDVMHPAFANLFIQTEFDSPTQALLAHRRPRHESEPARWLVHAIDRATQDPQFESDRARFLGRARTVREPAAIAGRRRLERSVGPVLDPIVSLRAAVSLEPGEETSLVFLLGSADSRDAALRLAARLQVSGMFDRTLGAAWTHSQILLRHLDIEPAQARSFQRLASHCLLPWRGDAPRAEREFATRTPRSELWRFAISGERPLVVAFVSDPAHEAFAWQLLRAQEYWRTKQIAIDIVLINDRALSYQQDLQNLLESLVRVGQATASEPGPHPVGALIALRGEHLSGADRKLLLRAAQVVLQAGEGTLIEQVRRLFAPGQAIVAAPALALQGHDVAPQDDADEPLLHWNGLGGFTRDGREYVIRQRDTAITPAPWVNVLANEHFGSVVSASGCAFSWAGNSREYQLTPWSNDPVTEHTAEACYVRDEDRETCWTPTLLPMRIPGATYTTRHGQGYTHHDLQCEGIEARLTQLVERRDPVKVISLTLTNRSSQRRTLVVTFYAQWTLGARNQGGDSPVITAWDADDQALIARDPGNADFGDHCAFFALRERCVGFTGDRGEFLGRNGCLAAPKAITLGAALGSRVGARRDPCGVLQARVVLEPGARTEVVAYLGATAQAGEISALLQRLRQRPVARMLTGIVEYWDTMLGQVTVRTPDAALDLLVNRWLVYQTIGCRLWARAAFFQAGGAYGFRDQLQDAMNVCALEPALLRSQLLRSAAHQFVEGDVQHWWHPPADRGVRTRCSDDRVWLPVAIAHYLQVTGDADLLDAQVTFLEGPPLAPDQTDHYFVPQRTTWHASLYEHGARALHASLDVGPHGLPLIGSGDWNDGMSEVGTGGKGESVWLAWFLIAALRAYAPHAERRGDLERARAWRAHADSLVEAIEARAWDGAWYRRAYFDDGTPLGTADAAEARIDSIAQSWAVLSGAGRADRAHIALASVREHLVRENPALVLLLAPPFDQAQPNPGYIRGYLPGVRENGGQYTQAAIWYAMACAQAGLADQAARLFAALDPIRHTADVAGLARYRAEPYVIAADVYSEPPHTGRGGWSWYTGSAGWMYRGIVESLLGVRLTHDRLFLAPNLPAGWPGFEVTVRRANTLLRIEAKHTPGRSGVWLDGDPLADYHEGIVLPIDGQPHHLRMAIGSPG